MTFESFLLIQHITNEVFCVGLFGISLHLREDVGVFVGDVVLFADVSVKVIQLERLVLTWLNSLVLAYSIQVGRTLGPCTKYIPEFGGQVYGRFGCDD